VQPSNPDEEQREEEFKAEGEEKQEVGEATEEEMANAATKIGAVFRGKKAREEVAKIKAEKEA
jgi:hypothetical protein